MKTNRPQLTSHRASCSAADTSWLGTLLLLLGLALLSAAPSAQAQGTGKRVALLIGNADYAHERKLRNPTQDAELLGAVLKNDLRFDDVRIEHNLGVAAMDRAIRDFAARARGADAIVFYYSGHGMKKSANDRRNFLLPVDARTGTPDALELERQAVAAESVRDQLRALGARVTLLVLDACRDGPGGGKSGSKGLARSDGGNQLLVAYATEEDRIAEDGTGRYSPYAAALAQALKRPEPLLAQLDWVADEVQRRVPGQTPTRDGNLRHNAHLVPPVLTGASASPMQATAQAGQGLFSGPSGAAAPPSAPTPTRTIAWARPTSAALATGWNEEVSKGVLYKGAAGTPVLAAAAGRVVYAGSGLRGFGNLVVIKHDADWMTAYAHNEVLLVKQDQQVKQGEMIARMGSSDADAVQLHFELRLKGKPVNPFPMIPQ